MSQFITTDVAPPSKDHKYLVQRKVQGVLGVQGHICVIWKGDYQILDDILDVCRIEAAMEKALPP